MLLFVLGVVVGAVLHSQIKPVLHKSLTYIGKGVKKAEKAVGPDRNVRLD